MNARRPGHQTIYLRGRVRTPCPLLMPSTLLSVSPDRRAIRHAGAFRRKLEMLMEQIYVGLGQILLGLEVLSPQNCDVGARSASTDLAISVPSVKKIGVWSCRPIGIHITNIARIMATRIGAICKGVWTSHLFRGKCVPQQKCLAAQCNCRKRKKIS